MDFCFLSIDSIADRNGRACKGRYKAVRLKERRRRSATVGEEGMGEAREKEHLHIFPFLTRRKDRPKIASALPYSAGQFSTSLQCNNPAIVQVL